MLTPPPPSILRDYALVDVTDDALIPPAVPPEPERLPDENDAAWSARLDEYTAARDAAKEAWRDAFERASETGQWAGLLVEGKAPTLFHVRQIGITAWGAFKRAVRTLGDDEIAALAFRLAVVRIDNLPLPIKLARAPYVGEDGRKERSFGDVLTEEVVDAIGLAPGGRDVIARIGVRIMQQRGAPLGK
jgi:hypothetical protein